MERNDGHRNSTASAVEFDTGISTRTRARRKTLAVQQQSKIDRELSNQRTFLHRPSLRVVITKWVSTLIIGLLLLGCLIDSKVSILVLSASINGTDTEGRFQHQNAQLFVMLQILVLIPNVINLVRGLWTAGFRSDMPWPRRRVLVVGFLVSLAESIGLCLFVFNIPGLLRIQHAILLMSCIFIIPLVHMLYRSIRHKTRIPLFVIAFIFEIAGISMTGYLINKDHNHLPPDKIWMLPLAVVLISVSWTPALNSYLIEQTPAENIPETNSDEEFVFEPGPTFSGTNSISSRQSGGTTTSGYQSLGSENRQSSIYESIRLERRPPEKEVKPAHVRPVRTTWKMTIWMSFWKIIFTFTISLLIFKFDSLSAYSNVNNEQVFNMSRYRDGWDWKNDKPKSIYKYYFASNIVTSIVAYLLGYIACTTCMQMFAYSVPLVLATPVSIVLLFFNQTCTGILQNNVKGEYECPSQPDSLIFVAAGCLVLAQALSTGWLIFRSLSIVMLKEDQLFWLPMYNSTLLEQWFMLVRKNEHIDEWFEDPIKKANRSRIIICTTMYREADYEMRQLLESIQGINLAQSAGGRHFEAHVFFDGAVKDKNPTDFVLQLVSLVESTLGVKAEQASKTMTPYGMTLAWKLKADPGKTGMTFTIHLKDNFKVKNKKRWSQVMYMSYVLDFLLGQYETATEEESYILTTDADVRFTPDSVEALLDLMTRDQSVGAVCARTHPLGSGPLVWYQVFEYAIGHWFQKAAEHVLGSVLCSPGCFSVYRCKAIRDILPQYASNVERAFEFLTKDMGEDRWFCTLMVQSGWRIEYCAASENSTHCPEEFDEFFKQRRRWVASTIANLMLLLKEWHIIGKLNHRVSILFLIYQAILLFATLIGPSSVILVVSGGIAYGWNLNAITSLVVQLVICIGFTLVCLFTSSNTQLTVAKLLTFFYAVLMTAVVVGTAVQISSDFNAPGGETGNLISKDIKFSTTTLYIMITAGIFILAGILHLGEFVFLLHGIWYLLCLPAGYLILMIYSICNITDRSWGTREEKSVSVITQRMNWRDRVTHAFKSVFFCCFAKPPETKDTSVQTEHTTKPRPPSRTTSVSEGTDTSPGQQDGAQGHRSEELARSASNENYMAVIVEEDEDRTAGQKLYSTSRFAVDDVDDEEDDIDTETVMHVKDWLPPDMREFAKNFIDNGFENTMLIAGMSEKELKDIGIKRKGMKKYLIEEIKKLPDFEIQAEVPENVEEWLSTIGLEQYKRNFTNEQIKSAKDMEVLKSFGRAEIEKELKITKPGHIKRLMQAIRKLRNPTDSELKIMEVKKALMVPKTHQLRTVNVEEFEFWDHLRNQCLLPQSTAFGLEDDLKERLGDLRNSWLMIFAVSNTLWLILIYTLSDKGKILHAFGSNPIGLVVLVLFGFVLIVQFFAMIVHRVSTLTHFLGRAPYRSGDKFNTTWAFSDSDMRTKDDMDAQIAKDIAVSRAQVRLKDKRLSQMGRKSFATQERTPLLSEHAENV